MDIHTRYDTTDVPEKDRFSYWQDAVCDSYVRLGCEAGERQGFYGAIEIARHSVLSISHVRGKSHSVRRRRRDIRMASEPYFLLSLQTRNAAQVNQFGQSALLYPGDMALYSSSDPYELQLTENFSQMVVQLPKEKLLARLPNAEMMTAQKIDGQTGIGRLVRENITAFSSHASTSDTVLQTLVQDTLIDLIATGLAAQANASLELSSPEQQILLRAKSYIRNNLGDPDLDRNAVAAQVGMSVRRLNAIFAKENVSLSAFIRQSRLRAVAEDLRDARFTGQSISEIALKYGFENFQNFSTIFRTHFDISPREYRSTM
ncbi:MAG: helix-turn-helix domain-containing protein [Stappiaceae bacterium]